MNSLILLSRFKSSSDGLTLIIVLINFYFSQLTKELKNQGLKTIEIHYSPYDNSAYDMAVGLYINYLLRENFTLLPTFEKNEDERAYIQSEQLFPGQTIRTIDSQEISLDGAVLNCITWNIRECST